MHELSGSTHRLSPRIDITADTASVSPQEFVISMLLASSDEQLLSRVGRALEKFNVRSFPAFTQDKAIAQLKSAKFDSLILDFEDLPFATPILRAMRESKMNRASMIIGIADKPGAAHEAFQCGANLIIPRFQTTDPLTRCLRASYYLVLRNKRASLRFPLDKEVQILHGQQPVMEGRVTNLSETGIKLVCHPAPEKGSVLDIAFQLPNAANIKARIRIIWSEESGESGAQFLKVEEDGLKGIQEWINTRLLGRLS